MKPGLEHNLGSTRWGKFVYRSSSKRARIVVGLAAALAVPVLAGRAEGFRSSQFVRAGGGPALGPRQLRAIPPLAAAPKQGIQKSIDEKFLVPAPQNIDDRMIVDAPQGIDDRMIVPADR